MSLNVLVLPVSGGGFASQLAILQHLCETKYIPDITLASSGGNVAAYVAAGANWKWAGIERIARGLTQDLFAKSWHSLGITSFVIGYFEGNVYRKGSGVQEFLSECFDKTSITKYEIWTGTYNKDQNRARLFCNRSKKNSIMDITYIDKELTQSMDPVFAKGCISTIGKASIASASIPAIVPPEVIDNEQHQDGGVAGASPLTIMQEPILHHVKTFNKSLHITYINSIDLSAPINSKCNNIMDTWRSAAVDIVRSQTVIDRLCAYQLLRSHPGNVRKEDFPCNYENLERVKLIRNLVKYSLLEIYPVESHEVNIVKFNGEDIIQCIRKVYGNCRCRLWWIESDECLRCDDSHNICGIIENCKKCVVNSASSTSMYTSDMSLL